MNKVVTIEMIREAVEADGFKLLSDRYINPQEYLEIECTKGHATKRKWVVIRSSGTKCTECARKWTTDKVQEYLDEHHKGYKILSEFKTMTIKIDIECDLGHPQTLQWRVFLQNKNKCVSCTEINNQKQREEKMRAETEKIGYTFVKFINIKQAVIICTNGHEYPTYVGNFYKGSKCQKCTTIQSGFKNRLGIDHVRKFIEAEGFFLLSDCYETNETIQTVQCDKGHVYRVKFSNFHAGRRCRECIRGRNHPNWKRTAAISSYLREHLKDWKTASLESADYKCDITGRSGNQHIHHKYPFHMIIEDMHIELDIEAKERVENYTNEEVELMIGYVQRVHLEMLGVVLKPDVHRFYHSLFGFNNSEEQYEFFKENYKELKNGTLDTR